MASLSQDQLRYAILEYLTSTIKSETLTADQGESLEVAVQCMSEAFSINLEEEETEQRLSLKPLTLPVVFSTGVQVLSGPDAKAEQTAQPEEKKPTSTETPVSEPASTDSAGAASEALPLGQGDKELLQKFIVTLEGRGFFAGLTKGTPEYEDRLSKAKAKFNERYSKAAAAATPPGAAESKSDGEKTLKPLRERLAAETKKMEEAEALKGLGNAHLTGKRYPQAIECYTKAIEAWPSNAVYYSNRAAAYTHAQNFDLAIKDCQKAIELKPDFSKAYSRLGTAHFQAGRFQQAIDEGYKKALAMEPSNAQYKQALEMAEARINEASAAGSGNDDNFDFEKMMSDPSVLENMMRDQGFMQMAQGMMNNPAMMGDLFREFGASAAGANVPGSSDGGTGAAGGRFEPVAEQTTQMDPFDAILNHPNLVDLKDNPKAKQIIQDMRTHGPMVAMQYVADPEGAAIFGRVSQAMGPEGMAKIFSCHDAGAGR